MRILVTGAGGIGGYFGGRLLEAGCDVTFLLRPARAALIDASGLVIRSPSGNATITGVRHVEKADRAFDLVLVTCKAYDLPSVMDGIAPGVQSGTAILPLLNGMRHIDDLCERFGRDHVLGGHCMISAAIEEDGAIGHYNELHHVVFGELGSEASARAERILAEFSRARFTSELSTTIVHEMWEKWVFIASLGCANTLLRAPVGDIVATGAGDLAVGCYEEACSIGERNGYAPRKPARERAHAILTQPDSIITASLFKDLEAGRRTEAAHIVGDLIVRGGDLVQPRSLLRIAYAQMRATERRLAREAGQA